MYTTVSTPLLIDHVPTEVDDPLGISVPSVVTSRVIPYERTSSVYVVGIVAPALTCEPVKKRSLLIEKVMPT